MMKPAARYDLFFNRVMFPIRDRRGRVISFGGRILGDGQPKYVNGPETALFSKRRTLYALDLAREAVRGGAAPGGGRRLYGRDRSAPGAGFGGAVAPLGTALTEEQLEELWRISPRRSCASTAMPPAPVRLNALWRQHSHSLVSSAPSPLSLCRAARIPTISFASEGMSNSTGTQQPKVFGGLAAGCRQERTTREDTRATRAHNGAA